MSLSDDSFTPRPRVRLGTSAAELDEVFTVRADAAGGRTASPATAEELDEVFGIRRGPGADPIGADAAVGADATDTGRRPRCPVGAPKDEGLPLTAAVAALVAAVGQVRAQVPSDLPGAQAVAEASVLLQQLEVLRAAVLARVADVDLRQLHTLVDAPSTGAWIAAQLTSVTRTEVAFARRLQAFPAVADALERGVISVAVAGRVAGALTRLRRHVDRPDGLIDGQPAQETVTAVVVDGVLSLLCQARGGLDDQDPRLHAWRGELSRIAAAPTAELTRLAEAFVVLASHLEPADVPGALGQLTDALLPDELERRAREGVDARAFTLRRKDDGSGWLVTRGELDLECGELLHTILTAELAVDPDNPVDSAAYAAARAEGWDGDPDALPGDDEQGPRTSAQRRHDALRHALRRYLDAGLTGLRDKVAVHLSVTVPLGTLHERPGAPAAVAASGARLPRSLVRTWLCDSAISRFVLGLGHRVIETSHTERTLKAHERRAKRLETGGRCQAAGCRCGPGRRLIPHHVDPYARSGSTSLSDTVLFCERDHHHLHTGRPLRLRDGRRLGPDGWLSDAAA